MTEIEKRANSMADWVLRRVSILKMYNLMKMFADMLTEQRESDIDKAWRWIELYRHMDAHWTMEEMKTHFRKAMEE